MATKIIDASKFKIRSDLENEVRNKYGLTPDIKPDMVISGTKEELARLNLSDTNIFWGIACQITDHPTKPQTTENTADRGKKTEFGINSKDNKEK